MSAEQTSMTSPVEHRDLRSERLGFKRDKEHSQKWSNGQRPLAGVQVAYEGSLLGSNEEHIIRVRPVKENPLKVWPNRPKSHANKVPKPHGHYDQSRTLTKSDAIATANDHTSSSLSKSLLELLPSYANNNQSPIQTAIRSSNDAEILYSFDNKGPSPGAAGRKVDLGGLVEMAEQKWVAEQTEKIVKGEYEVLDNEGEITALANKKKRGSPKQRATRVKTEPSEIKSMNEDDDDFELI